MKNTEDRGMKKWAPYASLIEQGTYLSEMMKKRSMEVESSLSEDQEEEINYVLTNCLTSELIIYYFEGRLKNVRGHVSKINTLEDYLLCENTRIPLSKIKNIIVM